MTQTVTIASPDGSFAAYLAKPATLPAPGIVVIQEIFGINKFVREVADNLAVAGYLAIAPDLFWRIEPGIRLEILDEAEFNQAFQLYAAFNEDTGTQDLIATLEFLTSHADSTGKVGTVGYCLGGKLAYLMATRSNAACNVSYYGVGIEKNLPEAANIHRPFLLHVAEADGLVPSAAQAEVKAGLAAVSQATVYSYPAVDHAFARTGGDSYNAAAAALANERTFNFLRQNLA